MEEKPESENEFEIISKSEIQIEKEELEDRARKLSESLEQLEKYNSQVNERKESEKAMYNSAIESIKNQLQAEQIKFSNCRSTLEKLKMRYKEERNDNILNNELINELKEKVDSITKEKEALSAQISKEKERIEQSKLVFEMNRESSTKKEKSLISEIASLKEKCNEIPLLNREVSSQNCRNRNLEDLVMKMQSDLQSSKESHSKLLKANQISESAIVPLRKEIEELRIKCSSLNKRADNSNFTLQKEKETNSCSNSKIQVYQEVTKEISQYLSSMLYKEMGKETIDVIKALQDIIKPAINILN